MDDAVSVVGGLVMCWLLAAIFAVALRHKVTAWVRFKAAFGAYQIVPERYVGFVAGALFITEFVTLIALLLMQPEALVLAAALLAIYAIAIAVNVWRGRRQIDCGCGDEPTPVSWTLVVRNMLLISLSLGAYLLQPVSYSLSWGVAVVAFSAAVVAFGIYSAVEQLIANRGRYERLWLGVT